MLMRELGRIVSAREALAGVSIIDVMISAVDRRQLGQLGSCELVGIPHFEVLSKKVLGMLRNWYE